MRWQWWGAAAGIAVAAIVVVATRSGGDDESAPRVLPTQRALPVSALAPKSAPGDGGLTVTEQGFTQHDETTVMTLSKGRPEPYKPVYAAFTLRNTSTVDVARPVVTVTYYDDHGRVVGDAADNWTYTGPVMPGATATFAGYLNIDSVVVTRMSVSVTAAKWYPAAETGDTYAALTARDVAVLPAVNGVTTLTYTATNARATPIQATGLAVFRAKDGTLLGARMNDSAPQSGLLVPPGTSTGSVSFDPWFPPGTDPGRLQVTLRPGNAAPDQ